MDQQYVIAAGEVMRNRSQPTLIARVRAAFLDWKHTNQWSNETTFKHVVESHTAIDGPAITGIAFEPATQDEFTRMRINGERITRWLDDESKDKNLLPANMLPSLLAALPMDRRASLVEDLLRPVGLGVRVLHAAEGQSFNVLMMLSEVTREGADVQQALIDCADGATQAELDHLAKQLRELQDAVAKCLEHVDRAHINRQLVAVK